MSDPQLTELFDRAVRHAPTMHLDGDELLAAGRGRVRRRRILGGGAALATVALAAAVWNGLAGGVDGLTGTQQLQPATTIFEDGQQVDGALFTGMNTIDDAQVGHVYDALLSRAPAAQGGGGPLVLEVRDGGVTVERITAQSPTPGLEVFTGERMTLALWREPEGVVTSVPLVGPYDQGGPSGVEHAQVAGEDLAYAVWMSDVVEQPEEVVDVYLVGTDEVVALSGAPVRSEVLRAGRVRAIAFADEGRAVWGTFATSPQEDAGSGLTTMLTGPGQVASSTFGREDDILSMTVLPEGATDVRLELEGRERGSLEVGALAGRPVALWVVDGDSVTDEALRFTLGGVGHDLNSYHRDLWELDLGDGRALAVDIDDAEIRLTPTGDPGVDGAQAEPVLTVDRGALASGLTTKTVGSTLVTFAVGWDGGGANLLADTRVELTSSAGTRWVDPGDVAQIRLADGQLLTVVATPAEEGARVSAVGRQEGSTVQRWEPPGGGPVAWTEVDGELVPTVDGRELPEVDIDGLGARLYHHAAAQEDLLVLPAGIGAQDTVVPLLRKGNSLSAETGLISERSVHQTATGPVRVVSLPVGMLDTGARLAIRTAGSAEGDGVNVWDILGSDRAGHLALDPGAVITVSGAGPDDAWLLYPAGDDSDGSALRVGLVGHGLLDLRDGDEPGADVLVAAVLQAGSQATWLLGDRADLVSEQRHPGPLTGLEVVTATVRGNGEADQSVTSLMRGLDRDADGEPDLMPAHLG